MTLYKQFICHKLIIPFYPTHGGYENIGCNSHTGYQRVARWPFDVWSVLI